MALALGVTAKQVSFISLNRDSNRCLNSLLRLPYNFLWNLGRGFHNTFIYEEHKLFSFDPLHSHLLLFHLPFLFGSLQFLPESAQTQRLPPDQYRLWQRIPEIL